MAKAKKKAKQKVSLKSASKQLSLPEMSKVEEVLLKKLDIKPQGKKEDRQDYLRRVIVAVDEGISQKDYLRLPTSVQNWYEMAAEVMPTGDPLPEFDAKKAKQPLIRPQGTLIKKAKQVEVPTWSELAEMGEGELAQVVADHDLDTGGKSFVDTAAAAAWIAKMLDIPQGVTLVSGKKSSAVSVEDLTWKIVHKMDEKELQGIADANNLGKKFSKTVFNDLEEAADWLCAHLEIEQPEKPNLKAQATGTLAKKSNGMDSAKVKKALQSASRKIGSIVPAKYREKLREMVAATIEVVVH